MNKLQGIPNNDPLFVTLNPSQPIPRDAIYDEVQFHHPVFDQAALKAQKDIRHMQGHNNTWFAGAWNRHGFHEDGIASAMRIVRALRNSYKLQGTDHAVNEQSSEIELPIDMRASA
jgi:predicted NAD/FAD-binding protein